MSSIFSCFLFHPVLSAFLCYFVPAKTVAQHSQSTHSNKGTVVDPYTCVDLLGPVFWQRSKDIVTTESFSCNEHDLEHQPSLELREDIAIQLLLKDADILYLREEKSSNSDLADLPRKIQLIPTSESAFSEKIKRTDDHHLRGLLALNHANLVAIWKIDNLDSHFPIAEIITKEAPFGDLKSYVLENRCQIVDIVTFLSQVASAMHYLHVKNIIHGDLRATYVNVVTHNK
ncbi:uncharacterized protein LOC111319570, partial [Stylophora pistillata]